MENGWIKINRSLKKKGYYTQSEYVHLWVHLLLSVNHEETEFLWNGKILKIKRGQFVTGRKKLALETGINEHKVDRILKCFESEQQIEQQTTTKYRLITVINYEKYQQYEQQIEQQVSNKRATSEQQLSTNNKLKNIERDRDAEKIDLPDWLDKGSWMEWVAYRKGRKLTTNEKTMKKQIDFLAENRAVHKEIINQSIMNGWQGLFPLKANGAPSVKKPESGKYAGLGTKINV
ncbi:MAG: hypothetical protein WC730_04180 [Patescibacteria group bacterium]|jgi:hypothetical protein